MPDETPARRRRRRDAGSSQTASTPSADARAASADPGAASIDPSAASLDAGGKRRERTSRKGGRKPERAGGQGRDAGERGLRDIVGAGHSQLGVSGALRARDVNRPTEADLAEAEATVEIVRRQWAPPKGAALPPGRSRRN